jgi:hypothetical protein
MMQQPGQRLRRLPAASGRRRRRRLWPAVALAAVGIVVLAVGWTWLWYYAAQVADRTLAGWVEREAAAGRVYSCATQTIGGFPFRIEARCDAGAALNSNQPPYAFKAKSITVVSAVYHPTLLIGDVTGPLTVAEKGQPPSFLADWSRARVSVRGLPPYPDSIAVTLEHPRLDDTGGNGAAKTTLFQADHADLEGRVIGGSARAAPVIEAILHLTAASAPTLHALTAEPTQVELDAVLRGFKDLAPKPWAERFREMEAADGGIEIKFLRIGQADAVLVGKGKLSLNPQGRLNGMINVAVVGLEHIVPQLGIDRLVGRGVNRLTGAAGTSAQGPNALDRVAPGLSGALRDSVNASVVENLKKMGKPTEIDGKPATILPLRFADGSVYLGILLIGEVPPLF